jgi:hypothetical protein
MLESTKRRLWAAYSDSQNNSYGVREEYRITFTLFEAYIRQRHGTAATSAAETATAMAAGPPSHAHLPFWLLDTKTLNRFRIADANRWIACLESIVEATTTFRQQGVSECLSLTLHPDQHSPLASAMCRLLHSSLGCHASDRSIWQGLPQRKKRKRGNSQPTPALKEGLNMKTITKTYGMMWFPSTNAAGRRLLEDHITPPRIQLHLQQQLAISDTGIQKVFKRKNIVIDQASSMNILLTTLGWHIGEMANKADGGLSNPKTRLSIYRLAAEVCIQEYYKWMWDVLRGRWEEHTKMKTTHRGLVLQPSDFKAFILSQGGSKELLQGLVGVGYGQIQSVFATLQYDFYTPAVLQKQPKDQPALTSLERTGLYAAATDSLVCNIRGHNALLGRAIERRVLETLYQNDRHAQYMQRIWKHASSLSIYQMPSLLPLKRSKQPSPTPTQEDVPIANGYRLQRALAFEQLSVMICHGHKQAEDGVEDGGSESEAECSQDEDSEGEDSEGEENEGEA